MARPGRLSLLPVFFGLLVALAVLLAVSALQSRPAADVRAEPAASAASEQAAVSSDLSALAGDEPTRLPGDPARRLDVELRSHRAVATQVLARPSDAAVAPTHVTYVREIARIRRWFEGAVALAGVEAARYRLGLATPEREVLTLVVISDVAAEAQGRLRAITPPAGAGTHHARLIQAIGEYSAALSDVRPTELAWGDRTERDDFRLFHATVLGVASARYRELPDNPGLMPAVRGASGRR